MRKNNGMSYRSVASELCPTQGQTLLCTIIQNNYLLSTNSLFSLFKDKEKEQKPILGSAETGMPRLTFQATKLL